MADLIETPPNRLYQILAGSGESRLTRPCACGGCFGMSAAFWMNLPDGLMICIGLGRRWLRIPVGVGALA
ncbi:MAG: hypothetical protein R2724_13720 [Bryobacterales bacterium]